MSEIKADVIGAIINKPNAPVNVNNHFFNSQVPDSVSNAELFYNEVKNRYLTRCTNKLDRHFRIPLKINEDWNTECSTVMKFNSQEQNSEALEILYKIFHEKGRLLVVGNPGSGKTLLLLKLALKLLGEKYEKGKKITIILDLASWSLEYMDFEDWLMDMLYSTYNVNYQLFEELLQQNQLILLLDGLDELARNEELAISNFTRAKCLKSLKKYLRRGRKVVISCRREEFIEMFLTMNQDAPVSAKVEILDLEKEDIILALNEFQKEDENRDSASKLLEILNNRDVLFENLRSPFLFTTAMEVVDEPQYKVEKFPTDADQIKKFLLNEFIEYKIFHTKCIIEFESNPAKVKQWLGWLANLMQRRGIVTFELADLEPQDLKRKWWFRLIYILIYAILFAFLAGAISSIFLTVYSSILFASLFGIFFGLKTNAHYEELRQQNIKETVEVIFVKPAFNSRTIKMLSYGVGSGITSAVISGLFIGVATLSTSMGIIFGLLFGVITWASYGIIALRDISAYVSIRTPYQRLSKGISADLIRAFSISVQNYFVAILILFLLPTDSKLEIVAIFPLAIAALFTMQLISNFFSTALMLHFYMRLILWLEGSVPLKYVEFLNCLVKAAILEEDGGHWRFRHQILQKHIINLEKGN